MIPLAVVRAATLTLGGLAPAFASFRALERGDSAGQRALLAYWVVFAALTAAEVPADAALSWLPLYSETKLALLLWLLTPRLSGALILYHGPLTAWLRRHQEIIDRTLQHAHLQYGVWALAGVLRGVFGVVLTLARAAWLLAPPPAAAQSSPAPPAPPPQPAICADSVLSPPAAAAAAVPVVVEQGAVRPGSGRPAPPLDTAQVTLLSAGLEESCAMLLRTALAAQAGNQLLASLHSQTAVQHQHQHRHQHQQPALVGTRKRHSRRRTVSAATAAESRPRERPTERSEGRACDAGLYYSNPGTITETERGTGQ